MSEFRYVVAPITRVEVRDPSSNGDNSWSMSGYAAVFNQETVLYNGRFMRVRERIAPTFFDDILRDQPMSEPSGVVHFNHGHDMTRAVAATDVPADQPGSLRVGPVDRQGLPFYAKVHRDDPDGVALAAKMRTGVVRQASFAFTIAAGGMETLETELEDGRTDYLDTLTRGQHLYDVCACAQGAYSQTASGIQAYARMIGQSVDTIDGRQRQSDLGGVTAVSSEKSGGADIHPSFAVELEAFHARAARATELTGRNRDVRNGHPGGSASRGGR